MLYTKEVTEYISSAKEDQQPILEELRQLVGETVENTTEAIKWRMPVFTRGNNFAYMRHTKNHVTFGFTIHIDRLHDPKQLLEGEGKTTKHVKIEELDDKMKQQIVQWLLEIIK